MTNQSSAGRSVRDECGFPIDAAILASNPMLNVQLQERKLSVVAVRRVCRNCDVDFLHLGMEETDSG